MARGRQIGWRGLSVAERLDKYAIPEPNTGCWLWIGNAHYFGYGKLTVEGKTRSATRLQWERFNGPIPNGLFVLHKCDVPSCVNPDHLFLGTAQDNIDDSIKKGRHTCGEVQGASKLKKYQVVAVFNDKRRPIDIARDYNINPSTVSRIKHGLAWKHLGLAI